MLLLRCGIIGVEEVATRNIKETVKELFEAFDDGFLLLGSTSTSVTEQSHRGQNISYTCAAFANFSVAERLPDKIKCFLAIEILFFDDGFNLLALTLTHKLTPLVVNIVVGRMTFDELPYQFLFVAEVW